MKYARRHIALMLVATFAISLMPGAGPVKAQDLVATEDLAGGSSVFVFRESRKRPQSRAGGGRISFAGGGRARSSRSNAQIAAAAQKRRAAAIAARRQEATAAAANRRIALSNTLTAKADGFLDNNQTDLAITNYRAALAENPKNTRASEGLSNALTGKGIDVAGDTNNEGAIIYFDEAVRTDSKNGVAYAKLGAIYDTKGQNDKAIVNYEKALAISPELSMLYPPLGIAYVETGAIAKAESSLQKANAAGVDGMDTRMLAGMLHYKRNENAEALATFDRALQLDPRFAPAMYYRGQTLERLNQNDQAIAAYKSSLEIEPTFAPASFDLGVAYYNAGDYNNALIAYQNVIKSDPNNYEAHANLASTYRQLERYAEANAEYKLASVGIKTADLYSEWGFCLGKTNEWDKSVARLETAKDMSPSAIDNSNLGWAYYNAGNSQAIAKNEPAAKTNYEKAKVFLQKAVEQDPRLDAAYLNLGSTHNAVGEFQAAVAVLNIVLGLRSDWIIAINQLGIGFRGLNDLKNAVATFKRAVDLDGRNTFGLFNLGEAYFASGKKNEAKKINDRLKKLDPTLAARLDSVITGKIVNAAQQQIQNVTPKPPIRIPKFPF
ncbi:MAG: tetratricopeptide repeat protein [Pyrinomonadaceae bacterium]